MGKYMAVSCENQNEFYQLLLTGIADISNELAEANRLERLKLKIEHFPLPPYTTTPPPCDKKELEDQG